MSKKSRTFQPSEPRPETSDTTGGTPPTPTSASAGPSATPPSPPSTSGGGSRAEARRRSSAPKATAQQSFFDRYRVLILGGAGLVVAVVAVLFFTRPGSSAYECVTFLTPPPATAPDGSAAPDPSPATSGQAPAPSGSSAPSAPAASGAPAEGAAPTPTPGPTPLLGFQTTDLGRDHAAQGASVRYDYCPPASGRHYNLANLAPLARRFYEPDVSYSPQNWIHNLEHGYAVILYKGDPGAEALDQLRQVMDETPTSSWSLTTCGTSSPNKVIVVRFDDLAPGIEFAAVTWDRALLQEQLDAGELRAFAEQWQDGPATPERVCG